MAKKRPGPAVTEPPYPEPRRIQTPELDVVDLKLDPGNVDEISSRKKVHVHIECMDRNEWFLLIGDCTFRIRTPHGPGMRLELESNMSEGQIEPVKIPKKKKGKKAGRRQK